MTPGIKLVSRFPKLPTRFRTWLWSVPKRITGSVFNVGNSSNMCSHKLVSQTSSGHWLFHMSVGSIGLLLVCDTDQQGAPCQTMTSCCCRFLQAWGTATIRLRATEGFFFGTLSCEVVSLPYHRANESEATRSKWSLADDQSVRGMVGTRSAELA